MDTKVVKIDKEQIDDEKFWWRFQQRRCMDWGPMR